LHAGIKRLVNPHRYPVGLEQRLHELKTALVLAARAQRDRERPLRPSETTGQPNGD
jgi:hypothetical protein